MDDSTPTRKSARGRVPNKKYSNDAFEGLNLIGSDSEVEAQAIHQLADSDEDDDFAVDDEGKIEDEIVDDSENSANEGTDGSGIKTPVEDYEDAAPYANSADLPQLEAGRKPLERTFAQIKSVPSKKKPDRGIHSRGLPDFKIDSKDPVQVSARDHALKFWFGRVTEDLVHAVQSREKWTQDITLPSRQADSSGGGGMGYFFSHTEVKRLDEATTGWDWYYKQGGQERMCEIQDQRVLSSDGAGKYLPEKSKLDRGFLMGPYGRQSEFSLARGASLHLEEIWEIATSKEQVDGNAAKFRQQKQGWILNVGLKVRCLDWAPNQNGTTQYLAVATNDLAPADTQDSTSAFTPSAPTPACIQIWAFRSSPASDQEDTLDSTRPPELVQVVCTDWGHPRQLRWCPIPRISKDRESATQVSIGLLAGIWSDGHVRVLDIKLDKDNLSQTTYVKYRNVGFEARPPKTICTCVTWISGTEIAVGCANGFTAIWNIVDSILSTSAPSEPSGNQSENSSFSTSGRSSPDPACYQYTQQTYILAIACAYPDHPHFIATSSMDGFIRLTDLRAPSTDFVLAHRTRFGVPVIEYHEPLQAFISTEENDLIRVMSLRRFFSSYIIGRGDASILSLSIGNFHSCALVGCADGRVIAVNPMRRVMKPRLQQFQQIWFQHEWTRRGMGMSRITEGYKVDTMNLMKSLKGDKKVHDGIVYATIYEENSGITQVAWNSNLRFGGWAAAGTANGLLRVEDLAL